MTENQKTENNTPVFKAKNGAFNVSVFKNTGKNKDGEEFEYNSIVLQRGYNKGTQEQPDWVNEKINLRVNDVKKAQSVLDKAYEHLAITQE